VFAAGYVYDGSNWHPCVPRSDDGGQSWTIVNTDTTAGVFNYAVAVDPVDTTIVYSGGNLSSMSAFYKSTDRGLSWTRYPMGSEAYGIYSLHVSGLDHNVVIAGCMLGIMRSTDAGVTWTRINNLTYNYALTSVPAAPAILYTGGDTTVYRSNDTGRTWVKAGVGIFGKNVRSVIADPVDTAGVYCVTTAGVFRSTDYGAHWQLKDNGMVIAQIPVVSIDAAQPRTVYVQSRDDGVFRSSDDGTTWHRQPEVLSCGNLCGIVTDAGHPGRIWMFEGAG
jgi:hypothetical protein